MAKNKTKIYLFSASTIQQQQQQEHTLEFRNRPVDELDYMTGD
jgi:hypothetical protein